MSIILPVRDGESYVGATIDSALQQTYRNIELIIVDDGSTDRTGAVIEARAAGDARVRVVHQLNRGVAAARNRALAAARGELVAPLDADDLWDPQKIERQVRRLLEAGSSTGLVYCWWTWIDEVGAALDRSPAWAIEGSAADALLEVNFTGNASVPMYRRRALERAGGYDESMRTRGAEGCEDWDAALKVAEQSLVAVVPSVLIGYRRRSTSMSARTDKMWRGHTLVLEEARKRRAYLSPALVRRSRDQFALHLAGVCYWSGAYHRAAGWALRAVPSSLALEVMPYVARLLSRRVTARRPFAIAARADSSCFDHFAALPPLIPYDRLYDRRLARRRRAC